MRSLSKLNRGKGNAERLKPFDFLLACHVKPFGYPLVVDPEKFHLVARYRNPNRWLSMPWINQYTGEEYRITTEGFHGSRRVARVKTHGDVLREYAFHPGSKSMDARGKTERKTNARAATETAFSCRSDHPYGKESNGIVNIFVGQFLLKHLRWSVLT